jgi:hypothetical protein
MDADFTTTSIKQQSTPTAVLAKHLSLVPLLPLFAFPQPWLPFLSLGIICFHSWPQQMHGRCQLLWPTIIQANSNPGDSGILPCVPVAADNNTTVIGCCPWQLVALPPTINLIHLPNTPTTCHTWSKPLLQLFVA